MPYAINSTKSSWRCIDSEDDLLPGETYSESQPVLAPTLAQQAGAILMGGLELTSTGTPALNGTYACDTLTQMDIIAIETSLNAGQGFPGGANPFGFPDASGALHEFTSAEFTAFAAAIRNFVYSCKAVISGQSKTLPTATATIA